MSAEEPQNTEERVGMAELRQNLSRFLKRVRPGHRIIVTDHNRPVAMLVPPPDEQSVVDRLIAEGKLVAPKKRRKPGERFEPVKLRNYEPGSIMRILDEIREDTV